MATMAANLPFGLARKMKKKKSWLGQCQDQIRQVSAHAIPQVELEKKFKCEKLIDGGQQQMKHNDYKTQRFIADR